MSLDFATSVESDGARMVRALEANREAPIPWCGEWTVQDCARHVGSLHHVIVGVIDGRPTANFGLFKTLGAPKADDPALGPWFAEGTAQLVERFRSTSEAEPCWAFYGPQSVAFWRRRSAHESFVHRWDMERAAGIPLATADPVMAADGVDEYLDVFAGMLRGGSQSPGAGETVHVHCTDTPGEWLIAFPAAGERTLTREHAKGDVAFRGSADALLLFLWGRLRADEAGVEIIGDQTLASRWHELVPTI
jgi:uncharacterized protein (TIGR03083 family)